MATRDLDRHCQRCGRAYSEHDENEACPNLFASHFEAEGTITTEAQLEDFMAEAIEAAASEQLSADCRTRIRSFESAGVLSSNRGLVVTIDGVEFQVTIIRSR